MKNQSLIRFSLALVLVFSLLGGATSAMGASQNLLTNGDFETGEVSPWAFVETTDGSIFSEGIEEYRVPPNASSTDCFKISLRRPNSEVGYHGGELSQTFTAPAGTWEVSAHILSSITVNANLNGINIRDNPKLELLVDDTVVDSEIVNTITINYRPVYSKLSSTGTFESDGDHVIKLRITSNFVVPTQVFVDNVQFRMVPLLNGEVLEEHGGHYYMVVPNTTTWYNADIAANDIVTIYEKPYQGHLATINSQEENQFVYNLMVNKLGTYGGRGWIGGYQLPDQNSVTVGWQWVTGETMSYTKWDPATGDSPIPSPNDAGGPESGTFSGDYYFGLEDNGENCMEMRGYGYWDDLSDSINNSSYVIEYERIIDLIADGGDNPTYTGDLHISYASGAFNVEFTIIAPWEIVETHVYIGDSEPSKSSPGQFPYSAGRIPYSTTEESVYIAAHAEIRMQTGVDENLNPIYVYESAWAQDVLTDEPIGKGKNWATYFEYILPED